MKQFTRREFITIFAATTVAGAAWKAGVATRAGNWETVSERRILMGTVLNLSLMGNDKTAAAAAIADTFTQMSRLEALLSRHQPGSALSRLNRDGRLTNADPALVELVQQAHQLSAQSSGAFDITIKPLGDLYREHHQQGTIPTPAAIAKTLPLVNYKNIHLDGRTIELGRPGMGITLDGIGKGYIIDAGTAVLREHGFSNVLVEAGGDLMAAGTRGTGQSWRIGIQAPRENTASILGKLHLSDRAVATSGDYLQPYTADMRHHHILDPRTGHSAPDLAAVTVQAPSVMLADGLATAVMVAGTHAGLQLIKSMPQCEALLVTKALETIASAGFQM